MELQITANTVKQILNEAVTRFQEKPNGDKLATYLTREDHPSRFIELLLSEIAQLKQEVETLKSRLP